MIDPQPPGSDWLTVREFARVKRVHPQTVREWIRLGVIHAERTRPPRGRWRIKAPKRTEK